MALKIVLKPHERMIISGAVITNGKVKCELLVENNVPILREKDILSEIKANSPCRRIYFIVQLMYLDSKNLSKYQSIYWKLVHELVAAAPSVVFLVDKLSEHILGERYYQALKIAKKLTSYEQEVLSYVRDTTGSLSKNGYADHVWTRGRSVSADEGCKIPQGMPG
jgi:flagellar protein FlbT